MQGVRSIFLLFVVTNVLFPWQMVCMAHPTGHKHHHEPGELSPCEKRKQNKETAFWPLMDCYRTAIEANHFQLPQNDKLVRTVQTLLVAQVRPEIAKMALPEEAPIRLPDPCGNSDPPLEAISLRGPPLS